MTYADYPLTVYAFHGCSREVAEAVLAGEMELKPSRNAYDWIGSGVYFWENAPERALRWAEAMHTKNPAVIGAVVSLGHCLNLMDKSSNAPLSDAFRLVSGLFSDKGEQMPANVRKLHYRDALVVNAAHSMADASGQPYDTVRAAFIEGNPVFDGSTIMADTHIQLCVRNPKKSIIAYFRPRGCC